MRTLLLVVVIPLLFGGGAYYGYSHWGPVGGGFVGVALLVNLVLFLMGRL